MSETIAPPVDSTALQDTSADVRNLVTLETVLAVAPIPDADAIEQVQVRGWTVVTKRGEFRPGDRCVYFEIDSAVPLADPRFAFLAPRGTKTVDAGTAAERVVHALKTARLRGVYSQGLVLPLADFPELAAAEQAGNTGYAQIVGVSKYEPPVPVSLAGEVVGPFPTHLGRKTDSERVQNLLGVWDAIVANGPWLPTEKLDGTSCSVFVDATGQLHVCGRNWELADGDNTYWRTVRRYGLDTRLAPGDGVQFEIYGDGIQANPLGVRGQQIAIFTYTHAGRTLRRADWPRWALEHVAPLYDLPFPASPAAAVAQVDGLKSLVSPARQAEGIVWHQADGRALPELDYRPNWKAINNKFLMKARG